MEKKMRKLYCFVDETGQDAGSRQFIVVAVIVTANVSEARERLEKLERDTRILNIKWHKSDYRYRIQFMEEFLRQDNGDLRVYFLKVNKPVFYYLPMVEIIRKSISANSVLGTRAIVCIDGLDRFSAKKFTNTLRTENLKIKLAKGARDESESLIRLADRWAGCIRMALSGNKECKNLVSEAKNRGVLKEV